MHTLERFQELLVRGSAELYADHQPVMASPNLLPTPNEIDDGDLGLFFAGIDAGLIRLERGARFNTADRPKHGGRWGLLSRSRDGGWYNAEYLPQLAAYVEAVLVLGYPQERVFFELPARSLQLDLAIVDDDNQVVVLGEAKRDTGQLDSLCLSVVDRFSEIPPGPETKKRGDEARQLAWRLWSVAPSWCWCIGPGDRRAFSVTLDPLSLVRIDLLPRAVDIGLERPPTRELIPPDLR